MTLSEILALLTKVLEPVKKQDEGHKLKKGKDAGKLAAPQVILSSNTNVGLKETLVSRLEEIVGLLEKGGYIYSCGEVSESDTAYKEKSILENAQKSLENMRQIDMTDARTMGDVMKSLQKFLLDEMKSKMCWMRRLGIYSAYAQIPFLIDDERTSGIRFDHRKTTDIYAKLDDLLSIVGIKQVVPAPFLERLADGDYEDATGDGYADIGNICPDYRDHVSKVDRKNVSDLIVDIDDLGLVVDGKTLRKARVFIAE